MLTGSAVPKLPPTIDDGRMRLIMGIATAAVLYVRLTVLPDCRAVPVGCAR